MTYSHHETDSVYASPHEERMIFILVAVGIFALTYGFFWVIDFLPQKPQAEIPTSIATEVNEPIIKEEVIIDPYPIRIVFDTLENREVPVMNPESHSIQALDTALLSGAVRHPDSADFERAGTIFLFGHSSYLPNVINKNFQAFNGIQKLTWGDTIRLYSSDREYVYRVDRVYEASANDAEVKIETGKQKLTLVTCDSFGSKSARFVVEATLIEDKPLPVETAENV